MKRRIAVIYGAKAGHGGLGRHAASVIAALADKAEVHAIGPGFTQDEFLTERVASKVTWRQAPVLISPFALRYTSLRYLHGRLVFKHSTRLGRWALNEIQRVKPDYCYCFTQVALETLRWAQRAGIPTILDNPNGHIRDYRETCVGESMRWCRSPYLGHPTAALVERVEEEYELADRIRAASQWTKRSMVRRGLCPSKIVIIQLPIDLGRYCLPANARETAGPLRLCYVGAISLAKGFPYLLRAMRLFGPSRVRLEIVGTTGDRPCRMLFATEREGLHIEAAPGDPVPAYRRAEILAFPTLHDGAPYAVTEAMACGLPIVVTDCCGAAEHIREDESGWVVTSADSYSLMAAMEEAWRRRSHLAAMGLEAHRIVAERTAECCGASLRDWVFATESAPT